LIDKKILKQGAKLKDINILDKDFYNFYISNKDNIFRTAPEMPQDIKNKSKLSPDKIIKYGEININYAWKGNRMTFLSKAIKIIDGNEYMANLLCDFWSDIDFQNTQNEGGISLAGGKKPEKLLKRIIGMTTNENDLVLDFFAGSGTTPAVAHKMNRRWIAIEQMNYIQDLPEARLKKVITGEQGGISKNQNWQGGGSFVYFELATYNQKLIDEILATKNDKMLNLWQKIKKEGFLIWNIKIKKFDQNLDEFEKCSLEEKRKILMDILNMNMIYVLLGNSESDEYGFTKDEIELNKSFFQDQYIYTDR